MSVRSSWWMCACVLSHFSRVWFYVTPWTVALRAPLSMGFSRQEYWSGLPYPLSGDLPNPGIQPVSSASPALRVESPPLSHRGSPKLVDAVLYLVAQSRLTLLPYGLQPARLLCPWGFCRQKYWSGCHACLQGIFPTQDWTQVSLIAGGFFTDWATRKPKNTGVSSLSLLQGIFPT